MDGNGRGAIEEPGRGEIPCPRPVCGSGEKDDDPKDSREIPCEPVSRDTVMHSLSWGK